MTNQFHARVSGLGIASMLVVALLGCSAPTPPMDGPPAPAAPSVEAETPKPVSEQPVGSVTIDPAWPWPASLPRPTHPIVSEFTAANSLGEGAVYSLEFTVPSLDAAQKYADALGDAGLEWMMDGKFEAPDSGDTETSVVAMTNDYMCTLTIDTVSLHTSFSFIGTWK